MTSSLVRIRRAPAFHVVLQHFGSTDDTLRQNPRDTLFAFHDISKLTIRNSAEGSRLWPRSGLLTRTPNEIRNQLGSSPIRLLMATIKTTIHTSLQLTVRTLEGRTRADELVAAIQSYYAGPVTRLILWDFENADLEEVTADQLHQLVRVTKELLTAREGGKTALVAPSDLAFGLGRMFDSEQVVASPKVAHKTFRGKDQALEWLFDGKKPAI